jgi:hypothetical protein
VTLAKLVILEMREDETEVGAVTEKRESLVFIFYNKPCQIFDRRGMTHVCQKSLLLSQTLQLSNNQFSVQLNEILNTHVCL